MPRSRLCWSDPSPSFGTQAEKIKGGWQTYHVQRKLVKGEARRGPEWVRGKEPSFRASTALPPPLQPSLGGLSLPSKHPLIGAGFNSFLLLRAKHTRLSPWGGWGWGGPHPDPGPPKVLYINPPPIASPGTRPSQHPRHGRGPGFLGWGWGATRWFRGKGWGQWVRILALPPPGCVT